MTEEELRFVERLIEKKGRELRNAFARGVLNLTGDKSRMQSAQISLLDGELVDGVERAQQYGLTSHPQPGAEVFVAFVGGDRGHAIVLAVDDRRYRIQGLEAGEVCIYSDEGDTITLKRQNHVEVRTKHLLVQAEEDVSYETKNFAIHASGSFSVQTASTTFATDALAFASQGGEAVTAELTGGINATEDLTANAGSVSLRQHVHEGVMPGGGNTQKPVGG